MRRYVRCRRGRLGRRLAGLVALVLAVTPLLGVAGAQAATLTNTSWSVSNSQTGATGVTYTYQFTTATTATIGSVTATVPSGTPAVTVGVGSVYGLGAGSAALSGTTLTYTVTTPVSVSAGIPVYIEFTGLTNTSTAGSYTSTVTTMNNASPAASVDSAASQSVTFGSSNTAVTVQVARSLTFTNDTPSFTLLMDPSLPALADETRVVTVSVTTNAGQGYTLAAADAGLKATSGGTTYQVPAASAGTGTGVASSAFAANTFGVSAALTAGGTSLAALQGALATTGNYVGYTTGGQSLLVATKPTGNSGDKLALTNRVKIDYTTPAGKYTDTITYTVTPTY